MNVEQLYKQTKYFLQTTMESINANYPGEKYQRDLTKALQKKLGKQGLRKLCRSTKQNVQYSMVPN